MHPRNPLHRIRLTRPRGSVAVLGYAILVTISSLLLLAARWPAFLMPLLSVPVVLAALCNYPRSIHLSMTVILVIASTEVAHQLSNDFDASLTAVVLGGLSLLAVAELIHRLVAVQKGAEETLQQRNRELAALNAVTATITATLELDQVFQRLVDTVYELFPQAIAATLQLLDESDGTLRTAAASTNVPPPPRQVVFRPGTGIAGVALAERRPINIADVTSDPRYLPGAQPPNYRSLLVAPLVVGERTWGTLSVEGVTVEAFQERDEYLIASLAQQAAIAIDNAQLYAETQRRLTETTILQNLSAAAATLDFDQVLRQTIRAINESLGVERLGVLLPDEAVDSLYTQPGGSIGFDSAPTEVPIEHSISGRVYRSGQSVLLTDVSTAPYYYAGMQDTRSELCVPLKRGQQVIGVLNAESPRLAAFDESDRRLFEAIGAQLAVALHNARLFEETARRAREQETIARITRVLNASLDVEQAFPAIVEGIHTFVDCERISLVLLDEDQQQCTIFALTSPLSEPDKLKTLPQLSGFALPDLGSGRIHIIPDLTVENDSPLMQTLIKAGLRSCINLPLIVSDQVIGALNLGSGRRANFTEDDLTPLQQLADALAAAIVNSQLVDRLRTTEAQYRGLFEGSADPIAVLDTQGVFLQVNSATCKLLGKSRAQILGQSALIFNPQDEEKFGQGIERALSGKIVRYEFSALVDDQVRRFESSLERIDYTGEPALQWTAHDYTARFELDLWREELTGITIHNLRNPLTWVKSGTEMARMLLPEETDPDAVLALDKAIRGVARLEQQIDVLLNINRAEAGQELTDQQLLSPSGLVTEVIELLNPRAKAQKVELQAKLPELLPMVSGNRNMLAWTLENLVDNAIKFSPQNKIVTIWAEATVSTLRINVTDKGPGVPTADRERIFQKFYQVRRPEGPKGSGIGLYFCKLAVEAHGGRIWVESNHNGTGATFSFTLPL